MKGHGKGVVTYDPYPNQARATTHCECGWSATWDVRGERPDDAWHAAHVKQVAAELAERQGDWYQRTGHCGACGQPGEYCSCTETSPCACRDLHQMGSALIVADALAAFRAVPDDQGELWQ